MIEDKIKEELFKLGFNPIHQGTEYLAEAILIIYQNYKSVYKVNLEKDVYNKLAIKYQKNSQTIKSNIIKATNFIDYKNNLTNRNDIKLTPKLVIWLVINKIEH